MAAYVGLKMGGPLWQPPTIPHQDPNWTPAHDAAATGNPDVLHNFQQAHNSQDANGRTPLMVSLLFGQQPVFATLMSKREVDKNLASQDGNAPIHIAARRTNAQFLEMMMRDDEVQKSPKNASGNTPLHLLVRCGYKDRIPMFKDRDLNAQNAEGLTPLEFAAKLGRNHCLIALLGIEAKASAKALHLAIENEQSLCVEEILAKQPSLINEPDEEGDTPLVAAAKLGHASCIVKLKECGGIDPNTGCPLKIAIERKDDRSILELLKIDGIRIAFDSTFAVADCERFELLLRQPFVAEDLDTWMPRLILHCFNREDPSFFAVLHNLYKVGFKEENISPLLFQAAIDPDKVCFIPFLLHLPNLNPDYRNTEGRLPLHEAADVDNVAAIRHFLASEKIDIDAQDDRGRTALHLAAIKEHEDVLRALLPIVNLEVIDADGQKAYQVAPTAATQELIKAEFRRRREQEASNQ